MEEVSQIGRENIDTRWEQLFWQELCMRLAELLSSRSYCSSWRGFREWKGRGRSREELGPGITWNTTALRVDLIEA